MFCPSSGHLQPNYMRLARLQMSVGASLDDAEQSSTDGPSEKRQKVDSVEEQASVPRYICEGIFAVNKPLEWSSNDVVSYIRGILERDARARGAKVDKLSRRRRKNKRTIKVGHGGTLDPLATGVLVVGVGSGTKELQNYLSGSKRYTAGGKLGFETDTLDMEGNVTDTKAFDHVTLESLEECIPKFTGKIMQVPPVYSAIRKDGARLYEKARKEGKTAEELGVQAREVEIFGLGLLSTENGEGLPSFSLDVECGGGTYIRSLVRDIGRVLGTCATMTSLVRTKQGQFLLEDAIEKDDLTPEAIYSAIATTNECEDKVH